MKKLRTSLDWNSIENELMQSSKDLPHRKDMVKLITNTRSMIDRLAESEIADRQHGGKVSYRTIEIVQEINDQINALEEALTIVKLIG